MALSRIQERSDLMRLSNEALVALVLDCQKAAFGYGTRKIAAVCCASRIAHRFAQLQEILPHKVNGREIFRLKTERRDRPMLKCNLQSGDRLLEVSQQGGARA